MEPTRVWNYNVFNNPNCGYFLFNYGGLMMEKNFIDKIYNNITYNTYNTIQNISINTAIGLIFFKNILLKNYPIAPKVAYVLSYILWASFIGNNIVKAETKTKDIIEIKGIYDEIITNYNKLNKIFDLNNPVEIHTMYNYLVFKGYLSKNKTFNFSADNARDIYTIYGANITNGEGVCRHIAVMLRDIFNDYGINSNLISVSMPKTIIEIQIDDDRLTQTVEEMQPFIEKYINNEEQREAINKIIEEAGIDIRLSLKLEEESNIFAKVRGNHAVTLAVQDENSYILDPTHARIYKLNPKDKNFLIDDEIGKIGIAYGSLSLFEKYKDIKAIKRNILLPSSLTEEDQMLIKKITHLCKKNQDIFEQFYNENKEIYDELSTKLMAVKKPRKLIKK